MVLLVVTAGPVKADGPVLVLEAQGRSLESGGAWGTNNEAKPGDTFLLFFEVKNTTDGTVANNVRIKVDLPGGEANPLVLTVHAVADNAAEVVQPITINLNGPASSISYEAGNNAEFVTNGVQTPITPDQSGANMTTQYVGIGNINGGDFSYAKVLGTTLIAPQTTPAPTATVTPTPANTIMGGGTVTTTTATGSAVAATTPKTGADGTLWQTLAFAAVGAGGYSIRKWAHKRLA